MAPSRKNLDSDSQFIEIIDFIGRSSGITPDGRFSRLVSTDYLQVDYERRLAEAVDTKIRKRPWTKRRVDPKLVEEQRRACSKLTAKRWPDTGRRLRSAMLVLSTDGDPDHRRAFSMWLGAYLVRLARTSGKPLAEIARDRLSSRLRRHVGAQQFGFWLHVERTRKDPCALHVHGIITLRDPSHFKGTKLKRLREQMIAASGLEHIFPEARLLNMHKANLTIGWINYCRKQRRLKTIRPIIGREIPRDIASPLEAWSGTLNKDAKAFYERARILYNGIISGKAKDWTDADWEKVSDPDEV